MNLTNEIIKAILARDHTAECLIIRGNVPSSKNSRVFSVKLKKSFKNKLCQEWEKSATKQIFDWKILNKIKEPLEGLNLVSFHFVRDSRRKFDYHNACQIVFDILVECGVLVDDSADYAVPFFEGYEVDKKRAGVVVEFSKL